MLNIRIDRKKFLNNIKIVENAIIEDKADGLISGIFIEAKNDTLVLKGIGEGLFIKTKMNCKVINPGEFVIKHKLMEEFLRQIEIDEIEIKETTGKISIISGKNSSEFAIYQYQNQIEPEVLTEDKFLFNRQDF